MREMGLPHLCAALSLSCSIARLAAPSPATTHISVATAALYCIFGVGVRTWEVVQHLRFVPRARLNSLREEYLGAAG